MPELIRMVFLKLFTVSLLAGVLILIIMAATPWLSRWYSPRWRYWIWLVFACWLVVPVTLPAGWAPFSFSVPESAVTRVVGGIAPAGSAVSVSDILIILWLLGAVVFLSVRWTAVLRFRTWLHRVWQPCDDVEVASSVRRIMAETGFRKDMDIRVCRAVQGPFVTGLINPVLVLPDQTYDPSLLDHIIRHELTHCRRRDLWYKLMLDLANAVHWFNPLVWIMNRASGRDLELVCDELVVQGQNPDRRREYGESILFTVKKGKSQRLPVLTTSFSRRGILRRNEGRNLQRRFENIMATSAKRGAAIFPLLAVMLVVLLGSAVQVTPGTDQNPGSLNAADGTIVSDNGAKTGARAIRLEGENHTRINHKANYALSAQTSDGKYLQIYSTTGPEEGYLIDYEVAVVQAGLYQMEICSTPHTAAWTSSYEYSVNGGSFVIVDNGNASEIGVVDKWFRRYTLSVGLEAGTNTITFRVARPRPLDNDGYFTFYLDYIELIPMDRVGTRLEGENHRSLNYNVFYKTSNAASEGRFLQIHNTIGPAEGYLIGYEVTVAREGAKWMEICASPHTTGWTSPWEVSINGGAFVLADDDSLETVARVNTNFCRYLLPVTLREGVNTITIRIAQKRALDDNYLFYLDYLEIYD
jgi:beta-lactamase regulating signal transducer with metallopeptidase domain